jgi:hypothetical protein
LPLVEELSVREALAGPAAVGRNCTPSQQFVQEPVEVGVNAEDGG